jgi:hypothetical protein
MKNALLILFTASFVLTACKKVCKTCVTTHIATSNNPKPGYPDTTVTSTRLCDDELEAVDSIDTYIMVYNGGPDTITTTHYSACN